MSLEELASFRSHKAVTPAGLPAFSRNSCGIMCLPSRETMERIDVLLDRMKRSIHQKDPGGFSGVFHELQPLLEGLVGSPGEEALAQAREVVAERRRTVVLEQLRALVGQGVDADADAVRACYDEVDALLEGVTGTPGSCIVQFGPVTEALRAVVDGGAPADRAVAERLLAKTGRSGALRSIYEAVSAHEGPLWDVVRRALVLVTASAGLC